MKTLIIARFFVPTTSLYKTTDAAADIAETIANSKHRAELDFLTIEGPYPDDYEHGAKQNERDQGRRSDGKSGVERRPAAAEARDEAGSERAREAADAFADGDDGKSAGGDDGKSAGGDDKPKRGRGRPPGSGNKAKGSAAEGGGDDGKRAASRAEGTERNEPQRTREGSREGADEGEGRGRSSRRSGDAERGNREAARISSGGDRGEADDGWGEADGAKGDAWNGDDNAVDEAAEARKDGDDWPDDLTPETLEKSDMTAMLGDHCLAASAGGKDKTRTFDIMERVTGERNFGNVEEKDYDALARALLHDIARFKYGLVKQAK